MKKEQIQEAMVADAVTEKPINFDITTQESCEEQVDEIVYERKAYIFRLKKSVKKTVPVVKDVVHNFVVNPPTLGKMQILSKYYLALDIDENKLQEEPHKEAMRVCEAKTDVVCGLMAVATLNTKDELLDDTLIKERSDFFKWNTKPQDFSTVLLAVLTQVNYANFTTSIRLTKLLRQNEPNSSERASRVE